MAIMPISPNTPQTASVMESPSPTKAIKTPGRSLSRADSANNQPHYDKDLPPTPTSSNHLAHPPTSTTTVDTGPHHHHPTSGLEPTPDNSALQLPPSTPSSSSSSSSSSHSHSQSHKVSSTPTATTAPTSNSTPTAVAAAMRTMDRPQSIALASGTYEREDLLVSSPQQPSPSEDKERIMSKRVTLMGPPPPYNNSGEPPVALDQQQPQRQHYQQLDSRYQQYDHHQQQQQQYQSHHNQHPVTSTNDYRTNGPESALILSQDNTPSSSRTTTTTLTTRTSTTPEPSNGLQMGQDRNGHTLDDPALPLNHQHHRSESAGQQNGHADSHRDRNRDSTGKGHQQDGQDGQAAQGGAPVDANGEDPARVKPRRVLGNYHMSKTLGAGSMGKVKLGVHSRTRDKVNSIGRWELNRSQVYLPFFSFFSFCFYHVCCVPICEKVLQCGKKGAIFHFVVVWVITTGLDPIVTTTTYTLLFEEIC
ncbi:MAG: hypothetical protein J3R72DRAFT_460284 [Linnemannia gamsii]|nr:MAG: hypothetical protein J3R72DRAFT_460284 [Linnemannia gamsii]